MQAKSGALMEELDEQLRKLQQGEAADDHTVDRLEVFDRPEVSQEFVRRFKTFIATEREYYKALFLKDTDSSEGKYLALNQLLEDNLKTKTAETYSYLGSLVKTIGVRIKSIQTNPVGTELEELNKKLEKVPESLDKINILDKYRGLESFLRCEIDTIRGLIQVHKAMEALNFSNVLISLTKLKMEINQWIEAKQKDIPDLKDPESLKLIKLIRSSQRHFTWKCELYFREFLSKQLQSCTLKPRLTQSLPPPSNEIFERLHKFEATNPDVKLFVILREPVISNPFFEFEELSATKNSEYLNIYVMNKLVFVYGLNKNSSKEVQFQAKSICTLIEEKFDILEGLFPAQDNQRTDKDTFNFYAEKIDNKAYAALCAVNCKGKKYEQCFKEAPRVFEFLKGNIDALI